MRRPRGPALVRLLSLALAALALLSVRPAAARAQDVLCDPGEKEVKTVRFEGNATFPEDELSARVLTTPSTVMRRSLDKLHIGLGGGRRCFPDIGLANDVSNLKAFYRNNGFIDTRVDTVVTRLSNDAVAVTFRINEGAPLILRSFAITGLDSVPLPDRDRILRDTLLKVGQRAGPLLVVGQRDTLISRLVNAGYPRPDIFRFDSIAAEAHREFVEFNVVPGARARFGTIAIHRVGVDSARPRIDSAVVLGLLGFKRGEVYSDRALSSAQRNLYGLTVFRHVDIALDTLFTHGDTVADVIVDVREDDTRLLDVDGGWSMLDCFRANSHFTDKNFQDLARRFDATASVSKLGYGAPTQSPFTRNLCYRPYLDQDSLASSKVNDYVGATITYPSLFGRRWNPSITAYTERRGQYQAYLRTTDGGVNLAATRDVAFATTFRTGLTIDVGRTEAEPAVLCALFSRCTTDEQADVQSRKLAGVASVGIQRMTTDNRVTPTRGYIAGAELRYAPEFLEPSLAFRKATGDLTWFRSLTSTLTFMARARGGIIRGGKSNGVSELPPPQERLYAGGALTERGFQEAGLGPQIYLLDRDQIDSVRVDATTFYYVARDSVSSRRSVPGGGNLLTVFNTELRIRGLFLPSEIEFAPFIDAGQVWVSQIERNKVARPPLAISPGLSIRYYAPIIGAVAVNLGYKNAQRAGPAYFATGSDVANRPLLCVTPKGSTPVVITRLPNGELAQDVDACPSEFTQFQRRGFLSHINWTFYVGTPF